MKKFIFFDFDGTLYPFRPYDSEDLLFCLAAETEEEKEFAQKLRTADENGNLQFEELINGEIKLLKGKDVSYIDKDASYISEKAGSNFLEPLKKLYDSGFEMYVVSCGLSDIADRYLELQNVRKYFSGIFAKNLMISNGKIIGIDYSEISCKEDKKKIVEKILSEAKEENFSVAVGDGFTDIPMFTATDKAVFVDFGANPFKPVKTLLKCGYPVTNTINEMTDYILSLFK